MNHRRWKASRWVPWALVGLLSLARPAAAQANPAPSIAWVRAPGAEACLGGVELAQRVEARLSRERLVALSRADIVVSGMVAPLPEAAGFEVVLSLGDDRDALLGKRLLTSRAGDCRTLDELIVFIVHVMLDPDAPLLPPDLPAGLSTETTAALEDLFGQEPEVPPLSLAKPAPGGRAPHREAALESREPRPRSPVVAAPTSPADGTFQLGLHARALASAGLMPAPAVGGAVVLEAASPGGLLLQLEGGAYLSREADLGVQAVPFDLAWGGLSGCALALPLPAGEVFACAGIQVGRLQARAGGISQGVDEQRITFNVLPALLWDLKPVGDLHVRLSVAAIVPALRDRFTVRAGGTEVFRMPVVAGRVTLGVGMDLL